MLDLDLEILRYQRLASLGRNLEGFVHNVAGPLNIVLGYAQVLQSKYPSEKGFGKIYEAALDLNKELKDLGSHLEKSKAEVIDEIDVNSAVLRMLELQRSDNFFKHNIESVAELSDQIPLIKGFYGDFSVCLEALLDNAVEAVRNSDIKKVVVKTELWKEENKKWVVITVRDTGEGFDENLLEKYFEPGFSNWDEKTGKSGIGLSLVKYIMQRCNGKIELGESCGCGAEAKLHYLVIE